MARFPNTHLTPRDPNKFASTNMVNELIAAVNAGQPPFVTGLERPPRAPPGLSYVKVTTYDPTVHPNYAKGNPCDVNGNVAGTNTVRLAFTTNGSVDGLYEAPAGHILAYLPTPDNDGTFASTPDTGAAGAHADGLVVGASRVGMTFRVTLTQDGGSAGSATTFCSFTYTAAVTVYNNGVSSAANLFTGATPEMSSGRIFHMTCAAATKGLAYWTGTQFLLAYAHETAAGTKSCT